MTATELTTRIQCCQAVSVLACLMAMETLIELTEPSICTFSFSLRLITTGVNNSSLLLLQVCAWMDY